MPLTSAIGTPLPVEGVPPGVLTGLPVGVGADVPVGVGSGVLVGVGSGVVGVDENVVGVDENVVGVDENVVQSPGSTTVQAGVGVLVDGPPDGSITSPSLVPVDAPLGPPSMGEVANMDLATAGCPATRTPRMAADMTTSPPMRRLSDSMIAPCRRFTYPCRASVSRADAWRWRPISSRVRHDPNPHPSVLPRLDHATEPRALGLAQAPQLGRVQE